MDDSDKIRLGTEGHISEQHLTIFGAFMFFSAKNENMMHFAIAHLLRLDIMKSFVVSHPLTFQGKRDLILALANTFVKDTKLRKQIEALVGRVNKTQNLRNAIAHCIWSPGKRENSIRPVVFKARGTVKVLGIKDHHKDYTMEDLLTDLLEVESINDDFTALIEGPMCRLDAI